MNVVYSDQPMVIQGASLFLCGPTPRKLDVASWRPSALSILGELGFGGTVLVPERHDWASWFDYSEQVEWEFAGLEQAGALLFWMPRELDTLPGFTSNVEFGRYVASGRMIYGRPEGRPHNGYLDWLYTKITGRTPLANLAETVESAVRMANLNFADQGQSK